MDELRMKSNQVPVGSKNYAYRMLKKVKPSLHRGFRVGAESDFKNYLNTTAILKLRSLYSSSIEKVFNNRLWFISGSTLLLIL